MPRRARGGNEPRRGLLLGGGKEGGGGRNSPPGVVHLVADPGQKLPLLRSLGNLVEKF